MITTLKNNTQIYENYTDEDYLVWKTLYDRQTKLLKDKATFEFLQGLKIVNFNNYEIPNFEKTNTILKDITNWQIIAVPGIIDDDLFFKFLSEKKFPATTWLRKMKQLDYLEEPDMFHDVYAHVPLLTNIHFAEFLQQLGLIGLKFINDKHIIELLSRIYWYTIEFGLISEENVLKIYGAGILSSLGETNYSLSSTPKHLKFDLDLIINSTYRKDIFQEKYFIINSYEELYLSINEIENKLKNIVVKK